MTEDQAVQMLDKLETLVQNSAEILATEQHLALTTWFVCGLLTAGFLCIILFKGLK